MKKPVLDGKTAAAGVAGAAALLLARRLTAEKARCRRALAERDAERARADEEILRFAGLAAHDLQSPLRKAAAFAEQLQGRLGEGLDAASRDFLERLLRSVGGMQALVAGLSALSREAAPSETRRDVSLASAVDDALAGLGPEALTGARVRVYDLPAVNAEPGAVRRLLSQLLSNALKFHKPGAAPDVRVRAAPVSGGFVELRVEDAGVGFDPRAAAGRLFTPFGRLHSAAEFPGAGLGLSACRRIAERHGGSISAQSGPSGTVVRVRLPQAREAAWNRA